MSGSTYVVGADAGESAAWALVERVAGHRPRLVRLVEVYGSTDDLWYQRALQGAGVIVAVLEELGSAATACWVEMPPAKSRADRRGKRHSQASWIGLGERAGALRMAWRAKAGAVAEGVEPRVWWAPWRGQVRRGKDERDAGAHRIVEAGRLVAGAAERLEQVASSARRVDCAESILIAGAAALSVLPEPDELLRPGRVPAWADDSAVGRLRRERAV